MLNIKLLLIYTQSNKVIAIKMVIEFIQFLNTNSS